MRRALEQHRVHTIHARTQTTDKLTSMGSAKLQFTRQIQAQEKDDLVNYAIQMAGLVNSKCVESSI